MGDVQRERRINFKIRNVIEMITQLKSERNFLNHELQLAVGNEFLKLFEEIAQIDSVIVNLKIGKISLERLLQMGNLN
jgi:hypothetical protein